ncbi:MAG: S8 family serine peptidase [Bacteroidota bacterium]
MKNLLLSLTLLCTVCINGQVSSNMSEANRILLQQLEEQESRRLDRVSSFLANNPTVKASLINDGIKIMYIYDVYNGKAIYRSTDNLNAARATKTAELWTGGSLGLDLDGAGMTIGVWDGGPADNNHVEFENSGGTDSRVTVVDFAVVDGDTGFSSHGTHVTGTISANGTNAGAIGMASNVNVRSYNWNNDEAEMVNAANDATSPILISNHSYGVPINQDGGGQLDASFIGTYTQDARDIDIITINNPKYLPVMSAGNSGVVSYPNQFHPGFDKLTNDKNAKNSLIIANANPSAAEQPVFSGNFELTNLIINQGSSEGPTDDLRIKPDIAADGTNLLSTFPNNTYGTISGTSMSAPNTSGTLVLLQQYYNQLNGEYMNSATLRGLVCHTAIDDSNVGPDPIFGWGFLNARAAAQAIASANSGGAVIEELTFNNGDSYSLTFSAQAGERLSATICWTDTPGTATNSVNDATPRLVNDLDIRISDGTTTYFPWRLEYDSTTGYSNSKGDNIRDNIERIDIEAPATGIYTLTVTHKGTLQSYTPGPFDPNPMMQDLSLIVTGNNVALSVGENDLARRLSVYPNPSNGEFTISFQSNLNAPSDDVTVDIYDLSGRLVYKNSFVNNSSIFSETIRLNDINSGVYMVNISDGISKTSHKLIVE